MIMSIKSSLQERKLDHVQVEQQLLVIYAYLFYPDLYMNLLKR